MNKDILTEIDELRVRVRELEDLNAQLTAQCAEANARVANAELRCQQQQQRHKHERKEVGAQLMVQV